MAKLIDLKAATFDALRFAVGEWENSNLIEALRVIRATWKARAKTMEEAETLSLLRKEQIIRNELHKRMRAYRWGPAGTHWGIEKLIGHNPHEEALK